jgi:hypothetical protein
MGAPGPLEQQRATDVIDVRMGDDDLCQGEAMLRQPSENFGNVLPGVDDHGLAGGLIAEDGAVAAEHPDREGFKDHLGVPSGSRSEVGLLLRRGGGRRRG